MTDIQRQFKAILKLLRREIDSPETFCLAYFIPTGLRPLLRDLLPEKGYGVGQGVIVNKSGQKSQPVEIIIYDRPLSGDCYSAAIDTFQTFQLEHVLLVLDVALHIDHSVSSFKEALARIASVKALKNVQDNQEKKKAPKPEGQRREKIPKERLPVAIMFFNFLESFNTADENERFFREIHQILQVHPPGQRPDHIHFHGHEVLYRNPLLDKNSVESYETGLRYAPLLKNPPGCYVCKEKFLQRHYYYDSLCPACGDLNYHKRHQTADLSGSIALVTGARVKIGYMTALKLLRAGAHVIGTSRFPHDAARRYAGEADFDSWKHRLHIYGLDLRYTPGVEAFVHYLYGNYAHLDILINNAAQTIQRPPTYYAHLLPFEKRSLPELPAELHPLLAPGVSADISRQVVPLPGFLQHDADNDKKNDDVAFPPGRYDEHGQQVDNRIRNSWIMSMDEVPMPEMLEVHLVNAIAPGLLAGQLKNLMTHSPRARRYIINVSSIEGQFAGEKSGMHPHTNMTKAALNMLTRSIAEEYARSGIYVNSVDPGWVSDQMPYATDKARQDAAIHLPIDLIDAAARICDPIFSSTTVYGKFLKDYTETPW